MVGYERKKKPNGKVLIRATVGYREGKQVKVSKTFSRDVKEETILLWVLQAKENGLPQKVKPTQFDPLLDEWLEHKRPQVAVKTFKIYKLSCNAYLRGRFGEIADVTPQRVQAVIDDHAHLSPRSQELIKTYARMVFDYAVRRGYLDTSPVTRDVSIPKRRRKRKIKVLTVPQFDQLSRALEGGSELELALRTLLLSGLRVSELMALQPHHVTASTLTVEQSIESRYGERVVTPPKSDHAYRTITVPEGLASRLLERCSEPFVFGLGYSCMRDGVRRVCEAQELPVMTLHGLRHSHCTYLLAKGVNVLAVSKRLGHHSPAFTLERYGHLVPSMSDKVLEVLR